jgi:hypothetical protein
MVTKHKKAVKPSNTPASVMDASPVPERCVSLFPYSPESRDVVVELTPNPNKVDIMQPGLLGLCNLGETKVSLALWYSRTRDGQRDYYSAALHDDVKKKEAWQKDRGTIPPLHKLKFYEHRKAHPTDPDFATPECFIEAGSVWWGAMWVVLPEDPDDLDAIRYFIVFSPKPFRPALSEQAKENAADSVARLLERRREMETGAFYKARRGQLDNEDADDEIPGLD